MDDKMILAALIVITVIMGLYLIALISAMLVNRRLINQGFEGIPWEDCTMPSKMISFFLGFALSFIPWWIFEQYVERFYNEQCRPCISIGKCVSVDEDGEKINDCGCDPTKRAWSPLETCDGGYNKLILKESDYLEERRNYPMDIFIKYTNL